MDDDLVEQFCRLTRANRSVAMIYLELFGWNLEAALAFVNSGRTPTLMVTEHKAQSVNQRDLLISSFRTVFGEAKVGEDDAVRYLDQSGWNLNGAISKFKDDDHGSNPLRHSHSTMQSRVGMEEDEELTAQASDSTNEEGEGSTSSWMKYLANPEESTASLGNVGLGASASSADFFSTTSRVVNPAVALAPPQIASSSHAPVKGQMPAQFEEALHRFRGLAYGVSREEALSILNQFHWDVDMALNHFLDTKNKSSILPIPQRALSSELKVTSKGKGKAVAETEDKN